MLAVGQVWKRGKISFRVIGMCLNTNRFSIHYLDNNEITDLISEDQILFKNMDPDKYLRFYGWSLLEDSTSSNPAICCYCGHYYSHVNGLTDKFICYDCRLHPPSDQEK